MDIGELAFSPVIRWYNKESWRDGSVSGGFSRLKKRLFDLKWNFLQWQDSTLILEIV